MKGILVGGLVSLVVTLLGTRYAIALLVKRGYGQLIRDDGPTSHHTKRGTPTMGGAVVIVAVVVGYVTSKLVTWQGPSASGLLVLFLFAGLGFVGLLDDWLKISRQRSLGLTSRGKLIGQAVVAITFTVLSLRFPDGRGQEPASRYISFIRDIPWLKLPVVLVAVIVLLLIAGMSNAVNLTDGLDGLAAGSSMMVFGSYILVGIWQFNQSCATNASLKCYEVRDPHDLATIAACLTGACFGFLWWNASPAKIFMGDTGSLSLGGALAGLGIMTRTEILLLVLGGLFVIITASVILQVGFFKLSKGRRIFRMAPLQHHFELLGWAEVTIVIRFWIICGLCAATGLGIFYAQWVAGG